MYNQMTLRYFSGVLGTRDRIKELRKTPSKVVDWKDELVPQWHAYKAFTSFYINYLSRARRKLAMEANAEGCAAEYYPEALHRIWTQAFADDWDNRAGGGTSHPRAHFGHPGDRVVLVVAGEYWSHTISQWPRWFAPNDDGGGGNASVVRLRESSPTGRAALAVAAVPLCRAAALLRGLCACPSGCR